MDSIKNKTRQNKELKYRRKNIVCYEGFLIDLLSEKMKEWSFEVKSNKNAQSAS